MFVPPRAPPSDFPSDVLKWMKQNAAPKMAVKLMKCHKYFQHQEFPYHVVKQIGTFFSTDEWFYRTFDGQHYFHEDLNSIEIFTKKFWITEAFNSFDSNFTAFLFPKIAVCDIIDLELHFQHLSIDEFKFLTSSGTVEELLLHKTTISFENGDPVYFGDILKCVLNLKRFHYYNDQVSIFCSDFINTYKDMDASKITVVDIDMISYPYFVLFTKFMEHNPHIQYKIEFIAGSISAEEEEALHAYVQRITADSGITKSPSPRIKYPGHVNQEYETLLNIPLLLSKKS